jgi:tRNA (mo5U34)-methyltransferase
MVRGPMAERVSGDRLREEVAAVTWYHTIELPQGVVTAGEYDLRPTLAKVPFPESLSGQRCLDVGTHDGFWAFEMERRGGSVVAIDLEDPTQLDWPVPVPSIDEGMQQFLAERRRAFRLAHQALDSKVERMDLSVYNLSVDAVGTFDFAFIGTLLHHLRDPVLALTAIRRVVTGRLLICAVFSASKTLLYPRTPLVELVDVHEPFWNYPNIAGLKRQITSGGWRIVGKGRPFVEHFGGGPRHPGTVMRGSLRLLPRRITHRSGIPHVWILAEPVPDN